jgi:hypothetical protein
VKGERKAAVLEKKKRKERGGGVRLGTFKYCGESGKMEERTEIEGRFEESGFFF